MSVDASGKFGKSMVFAKWKGRNYVRQLVTPSNPRTAAQTGIRACLAFLGAAWAAITANDKASWDALAEADGISPFNAYSRDGMNRWTTGKAPAVAYPAPEVTAPQELDSITAVGSEGYATLNAAAAEVELNWALAFLRDTAEISDFDPRKVIAVLPTDEAVIAATYTDANLAPGSYYYAAIPISMDGVLGVLKAKTVATVVT